MWNEKIKQLAPENLVVLGVVQEQHSERTKLYKQWKQYDFQIAQDPMTKLGLAVVPVFVGIDEYGIVRNTRLRPSNLEQFLSTEFEKPAKPAPATRLPSKDAMPELAEATIDDLCVFGDQELLFGNEGSGSCDKAIELYNAALRKDPDNGLVSFRLGVAFRKKYDEHSHDDSDFDQASKYWTLALAKNPRQYIWRRRIEQYGPRLQKPYPFYDWVETAVKEIKERGETPVELTVALTQSEKAGRSKPRYETEMKPAGTEKIDRDNGQYISIESTMVPGFVQPGKPATVHLRLVPKGAKWNNESKPLMVWVESDAAKLSKQLLSVENPNEPNSTENRQLEFDLLVAKDSSACKVTGFALYTVCTEDGTCMFQRQDFEISVPQQ